jgi:hypothetical protein
LKKVVVEIKSNSRTRACPKDGCHGCKEHGDKVDLDEDNFEQWLSGCIKGVQVKFERIMA